MEDKRITKTKRALKSALLELLTTQAFDVISITELCKIANVSRITFYTHYKDKFALLDDILTVDDGRDRGRVGRGSADAVLLKRADERRVGVARGGLGEVLLLVEALQLQRLPLGQRRQRDTNIAAGRAWVQTEV